MLVALLRQLDAFASAADVGAGARAASRLPQRMLLGEAYEERRGRHRLAVVSAVQSPDFLSELAEDLAGVNMLESDPVATKELVAAAVRLDVLSAECAQQPGGARAPKRRRRGVA